ncbi:MAG: DUF3772 domain-containing protein [bacterium]
MTDRSRGQIARLCAGAVLAFWGAGAALAQDTTTTAPTIKVQADSSGALIPEKQRVPQTSPATATAADAEDAPVSGGGKPKASTVGAPTSGSGSSGALDYAGWERMAVRAENATQAAATTSAELDRLRAQLVTWRESLQVAQNANAARIATLRQQIDALGPAPAAGVTEPAEIAGRRIALADQLLRLQAPGIAADEAYQRADGLIGEIDRVQRERQANELLKLWPSPLNPGNWPAAWGALTKTVQTLSSETQVKWFDATVRKKLTDNLLLIGALVLFALAVLGRGMHWIDRLIAMLQGPSTALGRRIWGFFASLGLIVVPTLGFVALAEALRLSRVLGVVGSAISDHLTGIGLMIFAAVWLGARAFPVEETARGVLWLPAEDRAIGRLLTSALGIVLAVARLQQVAMASLKITDAAAAVLSFPIILVAAVLIVRMGLLIGRAATIDVADESRGQYRQRVLSLMAKAAIAVGLIGPLLAAVGYIAAASALVFPTALTLALAGLLVLIQRLVTDLYAVITRSEGREKDALIPVLIGFGLVLATLPLVALIWGARVSDLTELWTRFQAGFQLGSARISPTDFLFFAVVFAIGYSVTRLLQGAMRNSILPRTSMDKGGQSAVVSGLGYVGIIASALVAINSTGVDLSGLAIVAGALSVGIGFGLQTVVSNFVSGIILLIERPISEGDWIEVGPVQGIVQAISVRSTRIQTFDRSDVIVPNSDLISGQVTNWTRFSLTGRLVVPVAVPYTADARKVSDLLMQIAEAQPLVLLSPPPDVAIVGVDSDTIKFEIRVILRDVNFLVTVRTDIYHMIFERFAAEGLVFSWRDREYTAKLAADAAVAAEEKAQMELNIAAVEALWPAQDAPKRRLTGPTTATSKPTGPETTDAIAPPDDDAPKPNQEPPL